jgi:hypothetical protein
MNTKDLVIHLIREELRNKLLMFSLEDLGFDCSYYMLNISGVVLELAGFHERPDELHDWYFQWVEKALEEITFLNLKEMLDKWSIVIWEAMEEKLGEGGSWQQQ